MDPIILIGGGGHCRSCIDVIEDQGVYRISGIVDLSENIGKKVLGYPITADDSRLPELINPKTRFLITLGQIRDPKKRIRLFHRLEKYGAFLPVIISPKAYVSRHASLGRGTTVHHHALVNAGAVIGDNCIINTRALVEHDAVLDDHVHIATGAIVNGGARVGKGSFVGSNSVVREGITIGDGCVIGCNLRVMSSLKDGEVLNTIS